MKKTRGFLLAAGIMLALAFTLSCSDDKDDNTGGGGPDLSGSPINLFSLPEEAKQVYRITYHYADEHNDEGIIIDSRVPYEGGDVNIINNNASPSIIGKIESGKISFLTDDINYPGMWNLNEEWGTVGVEVDGEWVDLPCSGLNIPDDIFAFDVWEKTRADIPGEYCYLYAFLKKSNEVNHARLYYFSKAATINGTLTCQTKIRNINLTVSEGLNLIYEDNNNRTSNISKIGSLEWGLVCDD